MSDSTHGPCFVAFSSKTDSPNDQVMNFLWPGDTSHFCEPPPKCYSSSSEQCKETQPPGTWAWCSPADGQQGELIQSQQLHCQEPEIVPFSGRPATPCWGSSPNIPRTSQSGFLKEHHSCILIHTFLSPQGRHTSHGVFHSRFLPMGCAFPKKPTGS